MNNINEYQEITTIAEARNYVFARDVDYIAKKSGTSSRMAQKVLQGRTVLNPSLALILALANVRKKQYMAMALEFEGLKEADSPQK